MKMKNCILASLILVVLGTAVPGAYGNTDENKEYKVKAAFLYNFIKFTDWPNEKSSDANEPIKIGIVGENPFGNAFKSVKDEQIKSKKLIIEYFEDFEKTKESGKEEAVKEKIEDFKKCYLLFICTSSTKYLSEIANALENSPILVVGETEKFLENGGMIRFLTTEGKVRFEINLDNVERVKLTIRSQLLRLAQKVIKDKD